MQNTMLDSVVSSNPQELSDDSASSAIKLFENPLFKVRVIMRCSDPWFVAKMRVIVWSLGTFRKRAVVSMKMRGVSF